MAAGTSVEAIWTSIIPARPAWLNGSLTERILPDTERSETTARRLAQSVPSMARHFGCGRRRLQPAHLSISPQLLDIEPV